MSHSFNGLFQWADLVSSDLDASVRFYSHLFHEWMYNLTTIEDYDYRVIHAGGADIGGMLGLEHSEKSAWVSYVTVSDCAAYTAKAQLLGATILQSATHYPGVGIFALIRDPCGAMLKLSEREIAHPAGTEPRLGQLCWFELATSDLDRSRIFYSGLFAWTLNEELLSEEQSYFTLHCQGTEIGGMRLVSETDELANQWLPFLLVDDLDARCELATELGASQVLPPGPIPGVGHFAVLRDPHGAHFALFAPIEEAA